MVNEPSLVLKGGYTWKHCENLPTCTYSSMWVCDHHYFVEEAGECTAYEMIMELW